MKVIVTGSEGFIGKALVCRLKRGGIDVIRVDRRDMRNRYCVREAAEIGKIIEKEQIDGVFHLAAQTSVFNENLEQIRKDNIDSFMAVVDVCCKRSVKLVYASSSTANEGNTSSMYGISKRFDEEYARCYLPSATGVRLHNVYGPDPREGTLLSNLLRNDEVTIYNGGRNIRHYTYIDDAVEGLIYAYGSNKRLVNVANPQSHSVDDFVTAFTDAVKRVHGQTRKWVCSATVTYIQEERPRDNFTQSIDESIFTVPLPYKSLSDGLMDVLMHEVNKDS